MLPFQLWPVSIPSNQCSSILDINPSILILLSMTLDVQPHGFISMLFFCLFFFSCTKCYSEVLGFFFYSHLPLIVRIQFPWLKIMYKRWCHYFKCVSSLVEGTHTSFHPTYWSKSIWVNLIITAVLGLLLTICEHVTNMTFFWRALPLRWLG